MGLDAYLERFNNYDAHKAYEDRQEQAHEDMWGATGKKYEELTDADKESIWAKQKKWDDEHPPTNDELDSTFEPMNSKVYPDHMFKIGYLRSSYNDGGINNILRNTLGKDLYYVFWDDENKSTYVSSPDWGACLARARELRDDFARDCADNGAFAVRRISMNEFTKLENIKARDENGALKVFREHRAKHLEMMAKIKAEGRKPNDWESGSYSTLNAEFAFETPMRVVGVVSGLTENIVAKLQGAPEQLCVHEATYLIYETGEYGQRPNDWYQKALEITVEMLEWVIAQPDLSHYRLRWSG